VSDVDLTCVGDALSWGASQLSDVADRPHAEAERLLGAILLVARTTLFAHPERRLSPEQVRAYAAVVRRRAAGEPLPYLLGTAPFFGMAFVVSPDVLIPRPETELLVERALAWMRDHPVEQVVDVGTGSGCITVALATSAVSAPALPVPSFYAVDLSRPALHVARTNALRHGVAALVRWVCADLLTPFRGPVDLIVSNPPYVATPAWGELPASVRREPRMALLSGREGLDALRRLLAQASRVLALGGLMLVEIGETQRDAARELARAAFQRASIKVHPDLAGKDRLLEIRRSPVS
jgi:release factor glutamine methyltransferase